MCNRSCNHGVMKTPVLVENAKRMGLTVVEIGERAPEPPAPLPEQVMFKPMFDLVADKDNWKNPIDATIDAPSVSSKENRELFKRLIRDAVIFYTGSIPVIVDLGDKQIGVKAMGYYAAVGA